MRGIEISAPMDEKGRRILKSICTYQASGGKSGMKSKSASKKDVRAALIPLDER